MAKSELFNEDLNKRALYFKVLSHPARLQILEFLAASKECITGDISEELPLSRTTVNQHIKELKRVGLIQGNIEGVKTKYCLVPGKIEELKQEMQSFLDGLDLANCGC